MAYFGDILALSWSLSCLCEGHGLGMAEANPMPGAYYAHGSGQRPNKGHPRVLRSGRVKIKKNAKNNNPSAKRNLASLSPQSNSFFLNKTRFYCNSALLRGHDYCSLKYTHTISLGNNFNYLLLLSSASCVTIYIVD